MGGDDSTRFAALLQPIRDLADNWNIDIARELEAYLSEIEELTFAFEGSSGTFNFAEAALLIQGSACIYSRKVEYLYKLVYNTLDLLASKRIPQESSINEEGEDKDVTELMHAGNVAQDEFLSLDDWPVPDEDALRMKEPLASTPHQQLTLRQVPPALMRDDGANSFDSQIFTVKGAAIGNRSDFRMNSSVIHQSGALLLAMEEASFADLSFRPQGVSGVVGPLSSTMNQAAQGGAMDHSLDRGDMDDGDDFGGFDDADDFDEGDMAADQDGEASDELYAAAGGERHVVRSAHDSTSGRGNGRLAALADPHIRAAKAKKAVAEVDPWKPLDPHSADSAATSDIPYRPLQSFRVPSSKSRKKKMVPPLEAFFSSVDRHKLKRKGPSHLRVDNAYSAVLGLFSQEDKRRKEIAKQERATLKELLLNATEPETGDALALATSAIAVDEDEGPMGVLTGYDDEYDFGGGADDDGGDAFDDEDAFEVQDYATTVAPLASAAFSEGGPVATTYEDLVRQHVEKYVAEAQQYVQETELTRRVHAWTERIVPILEEEEKHRPFDIHDYGAEVLASMPKSSKKKPAVFMDVAHAVEPYEVCRKFLATLQLANNGNVTIVRPCDDATVSEEEGMRLCLKNTLQAHEKLKTFLAPSLMTTQSQSLHV
eukprot:m.168305 g.168305  ORF g.168305 m.168305 type:complete len:656 (+) comp14472_c0_seq1:317-2284(+)